jgi:hypothetical protein
MGFFGNFHAKKEDTELENDKSAALKHEHRPIQTRQRLPIKLPEASEVGSSAGEEWRAIKGAVRSSGDG